MTEVKVPDIGDFKDVEVIEVLVKPGDAVTKEQSLITLESDKATMEIPSPAAGVVKELKVKVGDKVSEGSLVLSLEGGAALEAQHERTFGHLVSDLDLELLHHARGRRRYLHRRLVRLERDQRLLLRHRVARLHQHLDHLDVLEVADVRDFDFRHGGHLRAGSGGCPTAPTRGSW